MTRNDQGMRQLSARQEAFIAAMLQAPSIAAAAQLAEIADKTARRWLDLPEVQAALQAARRQMFSDGMTELKGAISLAVRTLVRLAKDDDTPASVRVRAAEILIRQGIEAHTVQELEARIAELEEMTKHGSTNTTGAR